MNPIKEMLKAVKRLFTTPREHPDPLKVCKLYKDHGCSHVDGFLCKPNTCLMREGYKFACVSCPVCGFYCLGKGGMGCINKPLLQGETKNERMDRS